MIKWFWILLRKTNNSIQHKSVVYVELNGFKLKVSQGIFNGIPTLVGYLMPMPFS